jgi:hypothetical protein
VKDKIPEGKTMCSLCSRLRRGILYRVARELKCNKLALGHHRDDMLQTFFLNMFFGGKLKGMPPKLVSDNGEFMVIRPLAYVAETDLIRWAEHRQFPIIPCTLCGSQENLQRLQVGNMLREWQKKHPGRIENMFSALQNVVPSHLMDAKLHGFKDLKITGIESDDGDKAFDEEEFKEALFARHPGHLDVILKGTAHAHSNSAVHAVFFDGLGRAGLELAVGLRFDAPDRQRCGFCGRSAAGMSLQGAKYRFERLPSQANNPEAGLAEQHAQAAMTAVGLVRDDAAAS